MNNKPIGFIDSGLGGLTILKETIKLLPKENYIFYADNLNMPYGNKTIEELIKVSEKGIKWLKKHNVKLIVLACGTISTNIADYFIDKYNNIIFIKTIPILNNLDLNNKTLFIATKSTCESTIIKNYKDKINILPCPSLATLIENNNQEEINLYLKKVLSNYKNINQIILGCTHYPLVKDKISEYYNNAKIIDFSKIIAKNVKEALINNNLLANNNFDIMIYNTKKSKEYINRCLNIIKKP